MLIEMCDLSGQRAASISRVGRPSVSSEISVSFYQTHGFRFKETMFITVTEERS